MERSLKESNDGKSGSKIQIAGSQSHLEHKFNDTGSPQGETSQLYVATVISCGGRTSLVRNIKEKLLVLK